MEKIPTAEEYANSIYQEYPVSKEIHELMIEFTKLHVEAALKEASKKSKAKEGQITDYKLTNSILNSYPLENIK
jgi:hypothetical protein